MRLARVAIPLLLTCISMHAAESGARTVEYRVKAAFLLNFLKFVEWPDPVREGPVTICVLGDDPFGSTLDQLVEGESVADHKVTVERISKIQPACALIFFPAGERFQEAGPGVLTVGETPEFLKSGGMISFVVENRRVRFDVHQGAVRKGNLRLSSRLLSVARSVEK